MIKTIHGGRQFGLHLGVFIMHLVSDVYFHVDFVFQQPFCTLHGSDTRSTET